MVYSFRYEHGDSTMTDESGNMVVDDADMDDCIPLESLCTLSIYRQAERNRTASNTQEPISPSEESLPVKSPIKIEEGTSTRSYRNYTLQDRENFFALWEEKPHKSIASIASSLGIKPRTAQRWVRKYNEEDIDEVPAPKPRGRAAKPKLNESHKEFLTSFVDENPSARLVDMMEALTEDFEGLSVSKNTVHRFLKDDCSFSFKMVRKEPVERNSQRKIEERFNFVKKIKEMDVDYSKNCVFIDEAGFNINMKRSQGWAAIGETPVVKTPLTRAENKTVLGAISYYGVVNLSVRRPKVAAQRKKRKSSPEESVDVSRGTVTGHFKQFIIDLMNELDKHPVLKGAYLVMDNASIHKHESIERIVNARGYRVLFLPPFSPELNPIEQFWFQVKARLKREKLLDRETLTSRILEAAISIPIVNIQHSIDHSINAFSICESKQPLSLNPHAKSVNGSRQTQYLFSTIFSLWSSLFTQFSVFHYFYETQYLDFYHANFI